MKFQRSISSFALLFTGIGSIIGSGWLFGPLFAAQVAGPASIISWIIGGLLMIIIALTFAELGTAFPLAGGMVRFAQYSHGPLVSFTMGWMIWLSSVAVAPVETMAIIQYADSYLPGMVTSVDGVHVLTKIGILVAAVVMFIMSALNWYGARFFSHTSNIIVWIKLLVPICTIFILFYLDFNSQNFTSPQVGGFAPYGWHGILAALPLGGVIYSFLGYNTVLQLAGEAKNPRLAIPLGTVGAIVFCLILYTLLEIVFIGALPADAYAQGWSQLHFAGDSGPFAGILIALGVSWFVIVIYADALISPFGTGFIYTAATARANYGLSRIGFFPAYFLKLTKHGVPMRGIVLNYLVGLLLFLPFPGWQGLVSFIISSFIISYLIGPIALIGLRQTFPNQPRPFRLPWANGFAILAFYICNLLIFWTGWHTVSRLMIALAIGFLFFAIHCYQQKNNLWISQWRTSWWLLPYLVGMCIISYLGTFGDGINVISFGLDFVVIALLTAVIFYFALKAINKTDLKQLDLDIHAETDQLST